MSNLCTVNQADSAQLFPGAAGGLMVGFCLDPLYRCHLLHQSNLRLYSGQLICHCCYSRLISESHPSFTQLGILPPCLLYCYLHQLLCKMHYVKQIRNFKDFYCLKWITCILKHIFFFGRQWSLNNLIYIHQMSDFKIVHMLYSCKIKTYVCIFLLCIV